MSILIASAAVFVGNRGVILEGALADFSQLELAVGGFFIIEAFHTIGIVAQSFRGRHPVHEFHNTVRIFGFGADGEDASIAEISITVLDNMGVADWNSHVSVTLRPSLGRVIEPSLP
ncbi:hypothetical protein D3C80_1278380 [compost metagenome]